MEPGTVINVTNAPAKFEISIMPGERPMKYRLLPGETALLAEGYSWVRPKSPGAEPAKSVIEKLTDGKVLPAADPRAADVVKARLKKNPDETPPEQLAIDPVKKPRRKKKAEAEADDDIADLDEVQE